MSLAGEKYAVRIEKDDFKFNAAHFVAYKGFREHLHGHNYKVWVRLMGPVNHDGYVIDFGDVKKVVRTLCKEINEKVLIPEKSDVLDIRVEDKQVSIHCEDGTYFSFPKGDCVFMPIVHSTVEEIASVIANKLVTALPQLKDRGISSLDVGVSEAPGQEAVFSASIRSEE